MSKKILSVVMSVFVLLTMTAYPVFVSAQSGLVPCGTDKTPITVDDKGKESGGDIVEPCEFKHLFILINTIIDFVFKVLVVPIAAILFAYAGFLMLFSGGNAGTSEKAKGIFKDVAYGLVIAAASWLIISTLLDIVGLEPHINTFGL